MKHRILLVLASMFVCFNLYSQNVQPTISDPKELAAVEQQKEEVFKKLFKDPTNLSLLFKYANLSIMVGDLEGAIGVFEQMLIYDSKLPRIRLELGVLYFRLGAYALANNYLKSVKEFNPPPEVEARVDQFLKAIVSAEEPFQWQQNLSIGFKRTTNGNSGINADFIEIGDFLLEVDQESKVGRLAAAPHERLCAHKVCVARNVARHQIQAASARPSNVQRYVAYLDLSEFRY